MIHHFFLSFSFKFAAEWVGRGGSKGLARKLHLLASSTLIARATCKISASLVVTARCINLALQILQG